MAAVTAVARVLRLDPATWSRFARSGSASAALVTIGAYALLAFDRFGVQGIIEPRATVRMLLAGFYGWLWLAGASWLVARLAFGPGAGFSPVFRLYGRAHLPLLVVGMTLQVSTVFLQTLGPGLWVGAFAVLFWMPALLVAATRTAFVVDGRTALLVIVGPYLVWLVVVGRYLENQLGHLL